MKITGVSLDIDPTTLAEQPRPTVTVRFELDVGQAVEQLLDAIRGVCQVPASQAEELKQRLRERGHNVIEQPAKEPEKRPGMDPARVLAAYDSMGGQDRRDAKVSIPQIWAGRDGYPESRVVRHNPAPAHPGCTVLLLQDGTKVLVRPENGRLVEVERKASPKAEASRKARDELYTAGHVVPVPSSRQSGPLAPPVGADAPGVPFPPVGADGCVVGTDATLVALGTLSEVVEHAITAGLAGEAPTREQFLAWAERVKPHVPALRRVAGRRFVDRVGGIFDSKTAGGSAGA